MNLFDDIVRSDASPAKFTESSYDFLNRANQPRVENIRNLLEAWFADYPKEEKQQLKNEFAHSAYTKHLGAWWELYVFTLYRSLGYEVKVHPSLPDVAVETRPDFLVSNEQTAFYVECTAVSPRSHSGEQDWSGQAWIYDAINEVSDPNFYLGLKIESGGTQQPRVSEVTRPLREWLATLDPSASASDIAPFRLAAKDWTLSFTAYPIAPERRTGTGRLLGILPPSGGFILNDVDVLHSALRDKGGKYGAQLDKPLIVALASATGFTDDEDVTDAVFGRKAVEFAEGEGRPVRLFRMKNGYWRPGSAETVPRGARVSGVLFGKNLSVHSVALAFPKLWVNPWAYQTLGVTGPFSVVTVDDSGEVVDAPGVCNASLFGLADSWPN